MSNSTIQAQLLSEGLSRQSSSMIIANLHDHAQLGQGVGVDALPADHATLVCWVLDVTGSMSGSPAQSLIDAYNRNIAKLVKSRDADEIMFQTLLFDSDRGTQVLHAYLPVDQVPDLNSSVYRPGGMTNLRDAVFDGITGAVAYGADLRNAGAFTKVVVVVMTDGGENDSKYHSESDLKTLIEDLLREETYNIAIVGIAHDVTHFAAQIGIPPGNVLNGGNSDAEINRIVGTVSNSTIRVSQATIATGSQSFFN
jgi:hypothetical protein